MTEIRAWTRQFIVAALVLVSGCGSNHAREFFGANSAETRQRVVARIPIGSTVSLARATMESTGFLCQEMTRARLTSDDLAGGPRIQHGPADFLWCDSG